MRKMTALPKKIPPRRTLTYCLRRDFFQRLVLFSFGDTCQILDTDYLFVGFCILPLRGLLAPECRGDGGGLLRGGLGLCCGRFWGGWVLACFAASSLGKTCQSI